MISSIDSKNRIKLSPKRTAHLPRSPLINSTGSFKSDTVVSLWFVVDELNLRTIAESFGVKSVERWLGRQQRTAKIDFEFSTFKTERRLDHRCILFRIHLQDRLGSCRKSQWNFCRRRHILTLYRCTRAFVVVKRSRSKRSKRWTRQSWTTLFRSKPKLSLLSDRQILYIFTVCVSNLNWLWWVTFRDMSNFITDLSGHGAVRSGKSLERDAKHKSRWFWLESYV